MALPRRHIIDILNEEIDQHNAALNEADPNGGVVGILNTGKRQFAAIAEEWNFTEVDVRLEARRVLRDCDRGDTLTGDDIALIYENEPENASNDAGQDQDQQPRRAVVRAPDDREFPFREIIGERLTPDGPVLKLDWEPSEEPVNHVAPEHVQAFRDSEGNARAEGRS
ncbi:hypothetical protein PR003_g12507 [Phytophthora rubi]|uniref:Uncharacterized protein n=1 Tax=Phytophthora rubi TaxID=129364 RepID=A0A6A3M4E5_9STRA|nr:hypothetical protein PR002_g11774 [Phytophthora rubi]KAE9032489.1 hypothetical protein PR001_g10581 [Phytophthora rubi]KAE9336423.1 hypothetical protein PR003_g12507 [Phytophthora rubi]